MAGLWGCRCAWSWRRARLWGFVSKLTLGLLCPRSNTVYSPAAIFEMLRIMRLGAAGKTAREFEGLLGAVDAEGDWMGLSPVDDWVYEGYEAALTLGVWFDRAAWPSEGFAAACARPCMACERVDFSIRARARPCPTGLMRPQAACSTPHCGLTRTPLRRS